MDKKDAQNPKFLLTVTTWTPGIARGTRRKEIHEYDNMDELKAAACRQIILRLGSLEHHLALALKKTWERKEFDKMLDIWKFVRSNPQNDPGLRLEWDCD